MLRATYRLLVCLLLCPLLSMAQRGSTDSLLRVLKSAGADTGRVLILIELAKQYNSLNEYDKAIGFSKEALEFSEKLNFKRGKAQGNYRLAFAQFSMGNYAEALEHFFAALGAFEKTGNRVGVAACQSYIGNIYFQQNNLEDALKYFERCRLEYMAMGDKNGQANSYTNIFQVHYLRQEFARALNTQLVALQLCQETANKQGMAACYINMGVICHSQGDSALTKGNSAFAAEKLNRAVVYFEDALKVCTEIGNERNAVSCFLNLGSVYIKQKKYAEAQRYLHKALERSRANRWKFYSREVYENFTALHEVRGEPKKALESYKLFIAYRDSLQNEENTRRSVQVQLQYEFDKRTAADSIRNAEVLKQEELKHDQEIQQQRIYTSGGIIGFVLMLVVAGISFNAYRQKQKANRIISEQKQLVEEKQKEILDSIYYARRIQRSLLPGEKYIDRGLRRLKG